MSVIKCVLVNRFIDSSVYILWSSAPCLPFGFCIQESMWYKITAERIGNIGRLNVRKVSPSYDLPAYHQWVVGESPASHNILDVHPR